MYNTEYNFAHQFRLELHDIRNDFSVYGPFWHKVMRSIPHTVLDNHVLFQHTQLQSMEFSREHQVSLSILYISPIFCNRRVLKNSIVMVGVIM